MAKHISGYSCPLSFKGSPYWMAPEVIKNSSGCNLAVDIWSLGCTVLEMATTKPPWSQYEGVAAMFKIGNSRDVPAIPDHLSAEGKDFIRQCLQRNPANRPSAAKLLEHSFVKDAAMCERPVISSLTSLGIGRSRNLLSSDSDRVAMYHSRGQRIGSGFGEGHTARTCPVSPIGSPLLQTRSPHQRSGRLSPSHSLVSSPQTMSASSTPLTGGPPGSIPLFYRNHPHNLYYQHDIFRGMPQPSPLFRDPAEANFLVNSSNQDPRDLSYDGQAVLANRVSHQLLKDPSQILRSQPN
jgi:serine/threonine protein kinase